MTQCPGSASAEISGSHETAEKLLIWAIRVWVKSLQNKTNAHGVLDMSFRRAGAIDAHAEFDGMMSIITNFARRQIDVRCPKCPKTSSDEMRMVCAIAACQNETDPAIAGCFLNPLVQSAGLQLLREPVVNLAAALLVAELRIRPTQKPSYDTAKNSENDPNQGADAITIH